MQRNAAEGHGFPVWQWIRLNDAVIMIAELFWNRFFVHQNLCFFAQIPDAKSVPVRDRNSV